MHIIRQRPKAHTVLRRREAVRTGEQPPVLIHRDLPKRNILVLLPLTSGVLCIPLDVHHNIFPAVRF